VELYKAIGSPHKQEIRRIKELSSRHSTITAIEADNRLGEKNSPLVEENVIYLNV